MKHKILITTLIAIGFSPSGASHALSVFKPDGTRAIANVEGNKLMLLASDGTYKINDGKTMIVSDGFIVAQKERTYAPSNFAVPLNNPKEGVLPSMDNEAKAGAVTPIDNKAKAGVIAPMNQGPDKLLPFIQPSAPGMGSPAATQRGLLMQPPKPGNEVAPGSKASTLGGQGPTPVQTTLTPQGTQSRASSKSPPKGPSGPEGSVPPKQ